MDHQGFLNAVQNLNENSYFYGNEVLYKMASDSDLQNKDRLAGMMWLIGRSYAASPQRRSYGTDKESNWPVRSDNDGRDQFFASVASDIVKNNDLKFADLKEAILFDNSDTDKKRLATSIKTVWQFNTILSGAIQTFDYAPEDESCNDHISFCSKFLHFYFPHAVFIIDTYAMNGGINLYNPSSRGYICDPGRPETYNALKMQNATDYYFTEDVYKNFQKAEVTKLAKKIEAQADLSNEPEAKTYINHCVRSYLLGCYLKGKIKPSDELAGKGFWSMSRLTDTVFLNIKGKMTKNEAKRQLKALERYKERPGSEAYKKYEENKEYIASLRAIAGESTESGT